MHETFKQKFIDRFSEPYEFETPGWGYFELPIIIWWRPGLGLPEVETYYHMLSFNLPGDWSTAEVEIDRK